MIIIDNYVNMLIILDEYGIWAKYYVFYVDELIFIIFQIDSSHSHRR